jgi:hypothetical protein
MGISVNKLLKDKRVLYAIAGLSALNVIGWMSNHRHESLIVFFIVMLIATRFTKNMILIIGSALVVANLLMVSRNRGYVEGMEGNGEDEEAEEEAEEGAEKGIDEKNKTTDVENFGKVHKKKGKDNEAFSSGKHDLDFAATLDQAYGRIDKVLGADGGKKWGDHMDKLFKKQNNLLNNLNRMEPVLEKMGQMAKKTQGLEGMLGMIGGKK